MKLSTQILFAFSVVILLSVADSFTNYLLSLKVEKNSQFLSISEDVIRNSNKTHKTIIGMQSGFRGYLLTNDPVFLDIYYNGIKNVPVLLAAQKELMSNNPSQCSILDSIKILHVQWLGYSSSLIESKKKLSVSEDEKSTFPKFLESTLKKQIGKKLNDEITAKFIQLDRSEYKIRNTHRNALTASISRTHTISFIFLTLTVIIGVCSTLYIVSLISKRIAYMVGLAENISKGDFSIVNDTKKDELTSLSLSLNIMTDKLNKNIKELENRNTELNTFAYVVSHDLKAPIRGIFNVIKWIEEDLGDELSPQMIKYLNIIPHRTKRMEDLINGLLDYSKANHKTYLERIDTKLMIKEISDSIVPRHFKVEFIDLPILYTERFKLEQVFANLISNSVKYTSHPNGQIWIRCEEFKDYYEFSVKDNGIGIDEEYHKKIFEIFQTLREKNEKESTGIGLAIVKKIIDEQLGMIKVYSRLAEGAEFVFSWRKNTPGS